MKKIMLMAVAGAAIVATGSFAAEDLAVMKSGRLGASTATPVRSATVDRTATKAPKATTSAVKAAPKTASATLTASANSTAATEVRYVVLTNFKGKAFDKKIAAAGGTIVREMPQVGIAIVTSVSATFADDAKRIAGVTDAGPVGAWSLPDSGIPSAPELSTPTANDDLYNAGWNWGVDRVHAPAAWANGHTGSHNTVVAVIDTGIATNHPDLAQNVVYTDCYTSAGDFASGACNPYPAYSDHGTHVAGTVAAAFGGGRVVGVAPNMGLAGYNVFEPITGCGVCAYSDSRWMAMIDAADRGFAVESMSLGGYVGLGGPGSNDTAAYLQAEKKVANYVKQQGTIMVASSGNGDVNLNGGIMHVPGDIPQMVNVAATGIQPIPRYPATGSFDIRAFYSNYGAAVDIAGPGGDCGEISTCSGAPPSGYFYAEYLILSTIVAPNTTCAATASCPVGYGWKGGTSMATPHVSAVAGLVADANPGMSGNEIKDRLKSTAENLGNNQEFGQGMVRADLATN